MVVNVFGCDLIFSQFDLAPKYIVDTRTNLYYVVSLINGKVFIELDIERTKAELANKSISPKTAASSYASGEACPVCKGSGIKIW